MTEQDERRAAQNQSLYRLVNEKIVSLNGALGEVLDVGGEWVCECADTHCTERIQMSLAEYEGVRRHPNRFAVLPGHVYPEVERVVAETDRYLLVEKLGEGARLAIAMNPRG